LSPYCSCLLRESSALWLRPGRTYFALLGEALGCEKKKIYKKKKKKNSANSRLPLGEKREKEKNLKKKKILKNSLPLRKKKKKINKKKPLYLFYSFTLFSLCLLLSFTACSTFLVPSRALPRKKKRKSKRKKPTQRENKNTHPKTIRPHK